MDKTEKLYHDLIKIRSLSGQEKEAAYFIGGKLEEMGLKPHYTHYKDFV